MIRSKPSTDVYREAWERVFGKKLDGALRDAATELEPKPTFKFYGGSLDGQTRENVRGKLETVEKCTKAAGHEDRCEYEVVES